MERWIGKIAIVTGASAGIGEGIVRSLVGAGINVVGLARRKDRLEKIAEGLKGAKGKLHPIQCDLRNENDILKAFKWTNVELGGVDIFVNNAGVGSATWIADSTTEAFRNILNVNVLAAAICTREAVKSMRARNTEAHIFYVTSVMAYNATFAKIPTNLYPASKFALRGMIQNVRNEIQLTGDCIRITNIIPALVKTDIFRGTNVNFDKTPHLLPKDIADGVTFALTAAPNVQIDDMTISPMHRKP